MSRQGEAAAQKHNLPRYIDGSCRREPDFEAAYPALSALCRGGIFVPKLKEGDVVVYLTKKGRYENLPPHRRLVASVTIYKKFTSHHDAAAWYNAQNADLPKNCLVENNAPVAWEKTHQKPILPDGEPKTLENWDSKYQARAALPPAFCATKAAFSGVAQSAVFIRCRYGIYFHRLRAHSYHAKPAGDFAGRLRPPAPICPQITTERQRTYERT